jgi:hypothetical protein
MGVFAFVIGGKVANTIVADQNFINTAIGLVYDSAIDITSVTPQPGVGWSYDGTNWTAPSASQTDAINAALNASAVFGTNLMRQFEIANVAAGITQANMTATITDATHMLYHYLVTGSLYGAITELNNLSSNLALATWSPYITTTILTNYCNQIQAFLGIPLT